MMALSPSENAAASWSIGSHSGEKGPLDGMCVLLAADFPAPMNGCPDSTADAVSAVARAVFGAGGRIVTAWHPTFAGMLLLIADELSKPMAVDIYCPEAQDDHAQTTLRPYLEHKVGRLIDVSLREQPPQTVTELYDLMLAETSPMAGFLVGGKSELSTISTHLALSHPELHQLPLSGPGGTASKLAPLGESLTQSVQGILKMKSYPLAAALLVKFLGMSAAGEPGDDAAQRIVLERRPV